MTKQWGSTSISLDPLGRNEEAQAPSAESEAERLRMELVEWAETDLEIRGWIVETWRSTESQLCDRLESSWPEEAALDCAELLADYDAESILLALLTDHDCESSIEKQPIAAFIDHVPQERHRIMLQARLREYFQPEDAERVKYRVLILGGSDRERGQLRAELERRHDCRIEWRSSEKSKGQAEQQQELIVTRPADFIIVIIGRIGHSLMESAKRFAQLRSITCRYVDKGTELQLGSALTEFHSQRSRRGE